MKEKRMNCETARELCIISALASMGHFPTRESKKEAWFLSPFRKETQASFKVSKDLNRWYDHGEGIGGNLIDLMMKITDSSVSEVLEILDGNTYSITQTAAPAKVPAKTKRGIIVGEVMDISHPALEQYLEERCIPMTIARSHTKEVHFEMGNRDYFAIGLKNRSGGWELRSSYWKGATSPKDVTLIKNDSKNLAITEGMFDMLTLLELMPYIVNSHDLLVLNTTAFVKLMIKEIGKYENVELFLDRDKAGMGMTELLLEKCPNSRDMSSLYRGFKDMNEWKVKSAKDEVRQRIQDVSLS